MKVRRATLTLLLFQIPHIYGCMLKNIENNFHVAL